MKKVLNIIITIMLLISLTACSGNNTEEESATKEIKDSENIAIHAGDIPVYLDEAKYYAYTAQASYETFYLTQEMEIDWNSEMTSGSTWETVVKGQTLDDICKRECMYALAEQYNVSLTEEEDVALNQQVKMYFSDTSEKLKEKIGIEEERLKAVFRKQEIAKKVETIMEAMSAEEGVETTQNKKSNEVYSEWKENNTVMATKVWQEIKFDSPIFTREDLTENQVMNRETTTEAKVILE